MKEKEFNLSDKIMKCVTIDYSYLNKEDVKEFIRRDNEITESRSFNEAIDKIMRKNGFVSPDQGECTWVCCNVIKDYIKEKRNKLAGDKLTEGEK